MGYIKIVCALILLIHFELSRGESDTVNENDFLSEQTPMGRFYSVTTCNYPAEGGYNCIGCKRALHCYPTQLAILVDCNGVLRPYCYEGRCSARQGPKCFTEGQKSTLAPPSTNLTLELTSSVTNQEIIKSPEVYGVASNLAEANEVASQLTEVNEVASVLPEANELDPKLTAFVEVDSNNEIPSNLKEINEAATDSKLSEVNEVQSPREDNVDRS